MTRSGSDRGEHLLICGAAVALEAIAPAADFIFITDWLLR